MLHGKTRRPPERAPRLPFGVTLPSLAGPSATFRVLPGSEERRAAVALALYAFLLLLCYYVLKTLREPLLLQNGSAELKSYANATIAAVLLLLVPIYSALFRRSGKEQLLRRLTVFFAINLALFSLLGRTGVDIGFLYYVWVGVFGLAMLAQFWAHAAHLLGVERGQRLFPVIMCGAVVGGLAGPLIHRGLFASLGPWTLMQLMAVLLLGTCLCSALTSRVAAHAPTLNPAPPPASRRTPTRLLGGFALVARDRYLLLLASMAVLMNCVNSTGEYLLAELVLRHLQGQLAAQPDIEADVLIGAFYADYYFSVNLLTVVIQVCLVARLFRWIGVHGALLVLPMVALIGYGLIVFLPVFGLIRAIKIIENGMDYSLMNTARHALYLPLPVEHKYEGKTAIDTFFWRLGDLVQAALVFLGIHWFGFELKDFAMLNVLLVLVWLSVALSIGKSYRRCASRVSATAWRRLATAAASIVLIFWLVSPGASAETHPEAPAPLFASQTPLELEIRLDMREFCLHPERRRCEDTPASLVYTAADGREREVAARLRVRGRVRTAACTFPPLFVFVLAEDTPDSLFAGQTMVPLTTHCRRHPRFYEQYTLKEYLAYRIYNELTENSLRVRLARITYRDMRRPERPVERYGFFTEHFESLAARTGAELRLPERRFHPDSADSMELGTLTLFQYLIGNTDWSVIYGHNVFHVRGPNGPAAIAYDFDYSGLVDAEYAVPPENLPLRRVTQRLFRGFCREEKDWQALFDHFADKRAAIEQLVDAVPDLHKRHREAARQYLASFFETLESHESLPAKIMHRCRPVNLENEPGGNHP